MKKAIINAACELFAQKGFGATSIMEIASAMGISTGTIMYHFGAKQNLLQAVLDKHNDSLTQCLLAATQKANGNGGGLEHFISSYFDHLESNSAGWRVFMMESVGQGQASINACSSFPIVFNILNVLLGKAPCAGEGSQGNCEPSLQIAAMLTGSAWLLLAAGRTRYELEQSVLKFARQVPDETSKQKASRDEKTVFAKAQNGLG